MPKQGSTKYAAVLGARIEPEVLAQFIANAEACKSTKDIVLRELVYAFNRFCDGGRTPVLQELEVVAPGYRVVRNAQGREIVEDMTPGVMFLEGPGHGPKPYPTQLGDRDLRVAEGPAKAPPDLPGMQRAATAAAQQPRRAAKAKKQ